MAHLNLPVTDPILQSIRPSVGSLVLSSRRYYKEERSDERMRRIAFAPLICWSLWCALFSQQQQVGKLALPSVPPHIQRNQYKHHESIWNATRYHSLARRDRHIAGALTNSPPSYHYSLWISHSIDRFLTGQTATHF